MMDDVSRWFEYSILCRSVQYLLVRLKTRMTWNLILKFLSLLILVVEALYLMNQTDATLASLSVLKYSRWREIWPSVRLLRPI